MPTEDNLSRYPDPGLQRRISIPGVHVTRESSDCETDYWGLGVKQSFWMSFAPCRQQSWLIRSMNLQLPNGSTGDH